MLATPLRPDQPLWGPFGFPYQCGVTAPDFERWALADPKAAVRELNPSIAYTKTVGSLIRRFCQDCPSAYRAEAEAAGTCIARVSCAYLAGGRPVTRREPLPFPAITPSPAPPPTITEAA